MMEFNFGFSLFLIITITGMEGMVEIESEWTARKRDKMGILPKPKLRIPQ
jgi:hypothetical protein